jgi:hypothetical protein
MFLAVGKAKKEGNERRFLVLARGRRSVALSSCPTYLQRCSVLLRIGVESSLLYALY